MFERFIIAKGLYRTKRGRKPKLTDVQICAFYVASTLLAIPILPLVKALGLKVHFWHIFRSYRTKRIYRCLRTFLKELNLKANNRQVLIVDGKLLKKGTSIVSINREILVDELVYGLLIMALVDERGKVVDIWLKPASVNEAKALKERLRFSGYLRQQLKGKELIGDKGYRWVEGLKVADNKEEKRKRQVIEGLFAKVRYLELSGWRYKLTILILTLRIYYIK